MENFESFVLNSLETLNEEERRRYCHTLLASDNAPLVVHNNTTQLTYVLEGAGTGWFDEEKRELTKGDIIYVSAGTKHRFKADENGLTLFHIHIPDRGREDDRIIIEGDDYDRYI